MIATLNEELKQYDALEKIMETETKLLERVNEELSKDIQIDDLVSCTKNLVVIENPPNHD